MQNELIDQAAHSEIVMPQDLSLTFSDRRIYHDATELSYACLCCRAWLLHKFGDTCGLCIIQSLERLLSIRNMHL